MRTEFDTQEFEFSHGHLPRGRGCWAVEIECETLPQLELILTESHRLIRTERTERPAQLQLWTQGSTTYGEAKTQVKNFLRIYFDEVSINVCP